MIPILNMCTLSVQRSVKRPVINVRLSLGTLMYDSNFPLLYFPNKSLNYLIREEYLPLFIFAFISFRFHLKSPSWSSR